MTNPTVGVLFSGMGGFASGLKNAGFDLAWANDNDPHACDAFRHRFADVEMFEKDVANLHVIPDGLGSVDVLAGAFPCQSFSQAGDRRGFDDPRGALFFEIPRLLQEWPAAERPRLLILENVPHLRYGQGGAWFDRVRKDLRAAGYWFRESACWTVNVKDEAGLPQDRERLFMVAASRAHFTYNPFSPPSSSRRQGRPLDEIVIRHERGADAAYLRPDNRYHEMIQREMARGESPQNIYQLRRSYVREKKGGLCPTLTANMGIGGHNVPFIQDEWGIRRLSVAEVATLQGFDSADFPAEMPEAEQYRLLGNAVCVELARMVGQACFGALQEHPNGR
jgi:DNA (cytosine-5)-methyltransferase 1